MAYKADSTIVRVITQRQKLVQSPAVSSRSGCLDSIRLINAGRNNLTMGSGWISVWSIFSVSSRKHSNNVFKKDSYALQNAHHQRF